MVIVKQFDFFYQLINVHYLYIDIQHFDFINIDAFLKYKEEDSLQQNTQYGMHRSIKANKDGSQYFQP